MQQPITAIGAKLFLIIILRAIKISGLSQSIINDEANSLEKFLPEAQDQIYVLEDKDYPLSLFENYIGVGQVGGITVLPYDDLVLFHRADRIWQESLDLLTLKGAKNHQELIKNDTIMIVDGENGGSIRSFGSNLFSMPHGIASDTEGNLWVTDVGRHQVMRLPIASALRAIETGESVVSDFSRIKPDVILGKAFEPGQDDNHFCGPAEVKIPTSGSNLVFVADGYCNSRVMVFTQDGQFLKSFGQDVFPAGDIGRNVIHSLALFERRNMICVAERQSGQIYCFNAGLDGNLSLIGNLIAKFKYPLGQVYAISPIGANYLLVSSKRVDENRYDLATLNLITGEVRPTWISGDLLEPHSMVRTNNGFYVYVADVSANSFKKVFKFKIIKGRSV